MVVKMKIIHEIETTYAECIDNPLRFKPIRDSWVVYHGTSSVFEQEIEDRGLEPFNRLFDPQDVDRVRGAFDNLGWYGAADSGYMFLASYSRDRHRGDRQNVYCCSYPDRKSTRLNSSHLGISYAVFCLKKKKKRTRNHTSLHV